MFLFLMESSYSLKDEDNNKNEIFLIDQQLAKGEVLE